MLRSPDHAALTPGAAPSFASEALVPSPLNEAKRTLGEWQQPRRDACAPIFLSWALPTNALLEWPFSFMPLPVIRIAGYSLARLLPADLLV
jgi:hypothetical protein